MSLELVNKLADYRAAYNEMKLEANNLRGKKFFISGLAIGSNQGSIEITIDEVDISENYIGYTYLAIDEREEVELWDILTINKFINYIEKI